VLSRWYCVVARITKDGIVRKEGLQRDLCDSFHVAEMVHRPSRTGRLVSIVAGVFVPLIVAALVYVCCLPSNILG
jgi:hypothetical protein